MYIIRALAAVRARILYRPGSITRVGRRRFPDLYARARSSLPSLPLHSRRRLAPKNAEKLLGANIRRGRTRPYCIETYAITSIRRRPRKTHVRIRNRIGRGRPNTRRAKGVPDFNPRTVEKCIRRINKVESAVLYVFMRAPVCTAGKLFSLDLPSPRLSGINTYFLPSSRRRVKIHNLFRDLRACVFTYGRLNANFCGN